MEIPIQNLYYLLCYAWNKLEERDIVSVSQIDKDDVVDLFSKVLIKGVSLLLKKGLDRGYIIHEEETSRIKGKINFAATLRRNFFIRPVLNCKYDELSHNVVHNKILKSTIGMLIQCEDVDKNIHDELVYVFRRLQGIDIIPLRKKYFRQVQLNRNNYFYDFLLKICELVWANLLICDETGRSRFKDFIRDENHMAYLFEEFVRNFYKKEQNKFRVRRENIPWDAISADQYAMTLLPKMETDISLISPSRKLVIDTKYYRESLQTHFEKKTIKSSNLYQLLAYLKNLEPRGEENIHSEGVLLYPTVNQRLDLEYFMQGHRVMIRTIDLNQKWKAIHEDLLAIIN